jgi:hypothetical protein
MPTDIKLKNSVTATNAPTSLQQGEVAINITDKKVWVGNAATTPVLLLGSGADGTFTNLTVSGVASFADGTVSLPSITNIGDTNTGIFFPAADTIAFTEGGAEAMRIDSSGQVGIGTTSPNGLLHVNGTINIGSQTQNSTSTAVLENRVTSDPVSTARAAITLGTTAGTSSSDSYIAFTTNQYGVSRAERMRIDSSGNVGIGTSSPSGRLDVVTGQNYNSRFFNNAGGNTDIYVNTSAVARDWLISRRSNGEGWLYMSGADPIVMYTNGSERMRIDSSGNLCLGQTTADGKFTSNASSASQRSIHGGNLDASTTTDGVYYAYVNRARTTAFNFFTGQNTSGVDVIIYGNGNIENRNNSYAGISDAKLKENIVDATPKLADLCKVKVRNYNFINSEDKQIGVIAQELETVFPSLVEETNDRDEDGNVLETTKKSVKYSVFVPMLIKAIQEQQTLIETLTTRLNALEGK